MILNINVYMLHPFTTESRMSVSWFLVYSTERNRAPTVGRMVEKEKKRTNEKKNTRRMNRIECHTE